MNFRNWNALGRIACAVAVLTAPCAFGAARAAAPQAQQPAGAAAVKQAVGTIRKIEGRTITLATDSGMTITAQVQDPARILRVEPGQTDLKSAAPMELSDLQVGDRILVRGVSAGDAATWPVTVVVAMKHADVQAKQQAVMADWRKRGVGGLVSGVDPATGTVNISVVTAAGAKTVAIHTDKNTIIRRYAPDSVKIEDAKPSVLSDIRPGDQLQARGEHSADGTSLNAEEVVSGAFRNISGTVDSVNPGQNSLTVTDLVTKKPVVIKIGTQSQLRQLPPGIAQAIAFRLKAASAAPAAGAPATAGAGGASAGGPRTARAGGAQTDFQQVVNRSPAVRLADLQKGDAVMIVGATSDNSSAVNAIMLVSGVEPILTASPSGGQSVTLSPWSLGGPADAEAAP